jgi:GT2 family glycosyltransferase
MKSISFLINTSVNTRSHVELLIKSLKENLSGRNHEILVFIDSDNEGTLEYLLQEKNNFFDLRIITHDLFPCVGYARNNNFLVEHAKHDIVSYLQSDMVISKDYDLNILSALEDNCILSSTRIEPPLHGESPIIVTMNFGLSPEEFRWDEFMKFSEEIKNNREVGFFFAPITFYKKVWIDIGGYDTLFRRSREDSDFVNRCLKRGIKMKQTFAANVYHFTCTSSRGKGWFDKNNEEANNRVKLQQVADSIELTRFIRKWGRFSHGAVSKKFDIDLVLSGNFSNKLNLIRNLEMFVSRVWLDSDDLIESLKNSFESDHIPANKLCNFDSEHWDKTKKYYNKVNVDDIFMVGSPTDFNIRLELTSEASEGIQDPAILKNIHADLEQIEVGTYEYGQFIITINKLVDSTEKNIVVKNPEIAIEHFKFL